MSIIPDSAVGALPEVIDRTKKTVVIVTGIPPNAVYRDPLISAMLRLPKQTVSFGTGFFINQFDIVTNYHVVKSQSTYTIRRHNSVENEHAILIGYDRFADIAILRVVKPNRTWLKWEIPFNIKDGHDVFTIGHPFGYTYSVSKGIISSTVRRDPEYTFVSMIQSDVAVNRGNSGGPLVNTHGNTVGIVRSLVSPNGGSDGISLALDVTTSIETIRRIYQYGIVDRAYIGLSATTRYSKVIITKVEIDGPAHISKVTTGDQITAINTTSISNITEFSDTIQSHYPGDDIILHIIRDGIALQMPIKLEKIKY